MDAATGNCSSSPLRIVICPWLAFGHMLPCLELAERLASRGHRVSFVSTPRNLARLPPRRHDVHLVPLPLPRVEGLPDGVESTNDVPPDKRDLHWKAFDGLAVPFAEFLAAACADEATRPDWVLADTFSHWAAAVALEHKVPSAMLLPSAAMIASCWHRPPSHAEQPRSAVFEEPAERPAGVLPYEWDKRAHFFGPQRASGMSTAQRCFLTLQRCRLLAMRSCPEWEPENFTVAAALLGKPLVPLGLLPPSPNGGRRREEDGGSTARCWLDAQPPSSVVYVALGSEVPLTVALVHELALGLELAGARFLWALRKPSGVADDADVLPPGFRERTCGRGLVAMGWVPQMSILAHGAVGGFLTHCGRNSLVEGLLFGHPLVMLPVVGDQGPNARAMERTKVGLQVARNGKDGSFDRHGVAAAVREVMLVEEARKV
ncbi:Transferase, transferring glycosyl groups [Zea mays]|nr:Transferase, transferring glycosyl groups [Zea mays]